jgi:hypothetical protein
MSIFHQLFKVIWGFLTGNQVTTQGMHRQHVLLEQEHQSTTNQRAVQPVYHESPAD